MTTHPDQLKGQAVASTEKPSHLPPQNLEAEEAVLGAMLMSSTAIERAVEAGLRADDFYRGSHRMVFDAIIKLSGVGEVDELVTINHLKSIGQLADVGGAVAVQSLADRVPAVANAKAYAQEVVSQATLRAIVTTGHEIARLGYEHPEESSKLVSMAGTLVDALSERRTLGASGFTTLSDAMGDVYDYLAERAARGQVMSGIPTALHAIDRRWGGLESGKLYIIAARPGMGKSGFMGTIAENIVLGSGIDVAVINLEMGVRQQVARSLARLSSINLNRFTKETPAEHDWQPISEAISRAMPLADRMHFDQSSDLTITQIRQRMRGLARRLKRDGRRLGAIFIDYLQLADSDTPSTGRQTENRTQEISKITRGLKSMALELELPIVALSQLSRQVEQRVDKRPVLSDLRESGSIEQDADIVAFLMRPEYYSKEETPVEWQGMCAVITAKARDGEIGEDKLRFEGRYTRFSNPEFTAGAPGGRAA